MNQTIQLRLAGLCSVVAPRRWLPLCTVAVAVSLSAPAAVDWPTLGFAQVTTNSISGPTSITHAGDGSQRLFITERAGRVRILQGSNVLAQPFLDISNKVATGGAEQGLLSIAFPPGFVTNRHFYADYIRTPDGAIVISRFHLTSDDNIADPSSEQVILTVSKSFNFHNGGQIAFGPDGYLYIGVGDGGPQGDTQLNGQKTTTLLGKILRIDVESGSSPYAIPASNPFVGNTNYLPHIWAYGVRNPWRFSWDRLTGDFYLGDVGQNRWEEINHVPAGSAGGNNFGWRIMEGPTNFMVPAGFTNFASLTKPVAWYDHLILPTDTAASVTGGYVYRGPSEPRLDGVYLYGDFIAGWIWGLKQDGANWQNFPLLRTGVGAHFWISTFGEDEQGQIYMADYNVGKIYQIVDTRQVWTPVFTPTNGTINSNLVMVTCATPNAEIHYTTNGLDPVLTDPVVQSGGTIVVATGLTNKARAFRADLLPSNVARAVFTNRVATPVFSPTQGAVTNGTQLSITTITPGASIFYTTNGTTPTTNSLVYTAPLVVRNALNMRAMGVAVGYSNSTVAAANYTLAQVATPVFSPANGPITNGTMVTMTCATPGSVIYYTTNGTTPTTNSTPYAGAVVINGQTTVNAIGFAPGYVNSAMRSVFFALVQTVMPVFSPLDGPVTNGTPFTISCNTPGSTIYFTLDGTVPTTNSTLYMGPIHFDGSNGGVTLSAMAATPEHLDSYVQATYFGLLSPMATVVTTFAGDSVYGLSNAVNRLARFANPTSICFDGKGAFFVADFRNNMIRKITSDGHVITFAGTGSPGDTVGPALTAEFSGPIGVCLDQLGNLYFPDHTYCNRIYKIDTNSIVSHFTTAYGDDGCHHAESLWQIESDMANQLYIGRWASVQKISPSGVVQHLAGPAACCVEGWNENVGIGVDAGTNVYAATGQTVFKILPNGTFAPFVSTDYGHSDGPRLVSRFQSPQDVVVDPSTNIIVSEAIRIRMVRSDGWVVTLAGTGIAGYKNGRGSQAQFNNAAGLCMDTNGNVYVADSGNNCIRKISPDTANIGIADDWQRLFFGSVGIDPNADPDHDGLSNFAEFWAGTDPLNVASSLVIDTTSLWNSGQIQIRWQTVAGKTYTVQYSSDLATWDTLGPNVFGDGNFATVIDPGSVQPAGQRYYRILLANF